MGYWQTASLVETRRREGGKQRGQETKRYWFSLLPSLLDALIGFVHVFDVPLEKKQVGLRLAIDL